MRRQLGDSVMQRESSVAIDTRELARTSIRVAAFTGGRSISSRRFRVQQYLPHLQKLGIDVTEYVARFGSWPPTQKFSRPFWLAATLLDRLPGVFNSREYDVTLLQREMVSTLVTLERFTRRPRILDVDDAVWLNPRADKSFRTLVGMCDGVICGNNFIAENVSRWHDRITVLSTAVDTDRFRPSDAASRPLGKLIIGWSGLNSGFKYLLGIEGALVEVLSKYQDAILRVVSDVRPAFQMLDPARVEYIPWSPENEVATIQAMNVGLMPIDDSLWSKGKCSYKMLLYMACGVPVVVSPYGMNSEILGYGNVGFGPPDERGWIESISWLLDNLKHGHQMGRAGRKVVEERFSLSSSAPRMALFLRGFCV